MPKGPQGQRRPADAVGWAVQVARIATGEEQGDTPTATAQKAARVMAMAQKAARVMATAQKAARVMAVARVAAAAVAQAAARVARE